MYITLYKSIISETSNVSTT